MPNLAWKAECVTSAWARPEGLTSWRQPGRLAVGLLVAAMTLVGLPNRCARAATGVVALLPSASLAPTLSAPLGQAVSQAVTKAKLGLIGPAEIETALQGETALRDCNTPTCLERLGRLVGATALIRFSASAQRATGGQATYQLQADYFNVEVGAQGANLSSTCASCTVAEAAQSLGELTKQVLAADAARLRGTLAVETNPVSATVFVDGNESGLTPYQRPAFVGSHTVILRATGYRSQEATVTVADQRTSRLDLRLVAGTDGLARQEGAKPVYKKWWFWTIIGGVAVAAAVTTGVVVSQNSGPPQPTPSANHISF